MATQRRIVVWTRLARDDLDAALAFVARDSPVAAHRMLVTALDVAASLSNLSARGRVVPEVHDPAIRETLLYSYRMIYRVTNLEVVILAFVHGARGFERWRNERE